MMMTPKLQIPIPLTPSTTAPKNTQLSLSTHSHIPPFLALRPCGSYYSFVITRWRRGVSNPSHTEEPMARSPFTAPSSNYPPATHPTTALCFRAAPTPHVGAPALLASSPGHESACQGQGTFLHPPMLARHMCCTAIIILLSQ